MLLALDAGNTNITVGVFDGRRLTAHWRLRTVHDQTADEWGILLRNLFALTSLELGGVDGIIVASVVPPLNSSLALMARHYFNTEAVFVTHETDTGLRIRYDNPREVGADRIVNGVAAFAKYGGPCVVVDLGTAITFDAISAHAEYLGGIICAGIGITVEGLFAKTARLPLVDVREPEKLIGTNTVGSMQSGLYYGAIGVIDGILERLKTSTSLRKEVAALIRHHGTHPTEAWGDAACRRFLGRLAEDGLPLDRWATLRLADQLGKGLDRENRLVEHRALLSRLEALAAAAPPLAVRDLALDGAALMKLAGRSGGPWLGELQRQLLVAVMDDPGLNGAEALAEVARKLMASD